MSNQYLKSKKFINLNKTRLENLVFDKAGEYVIFFHNLSGKFNFEIRSSGVDVNIFGLFTGKNNDEFKVETVQHHLFPDSSSNLLIKGVFEDESKLGYHGLIKIEKEGKGSHAYQKNQNLILSPQAFVESKPYLEIMANDVYCTHGSTIGRLNKDEIIYLQSRGIDQKSAEKLLVEGFIDELFDKIKIKFPALRAPLLQKGEKFSSF
ncbi:MAG: SufD family Fe-S cluster assembly protein [Candidatus Roizmanbacteria bacterium]|nr:MAG: SufD family Fe-S cluster assembly protein [Candidatus Roizmanbacteria bacterium]